MILLLIPAVLAFAGSFLWKKHCAESRRWALIAELRTSLETLTHALRVGVGFLQAMERVAEDAGPILGPEWRRLLQGVQVGRPLQEVLEDFAARLQLREASW